MLCCAAAGWYQHSSASVCLQSIAPLATIEAKSVSSPIAFSSCSPVMVHNREQKNTADHNLCHHPSGTTARRTDHSERQNSTEQEPFYSFRAVRRCSCGFGKQWELPGRDPFNFLPADTASKPRWCMLQMMASNLWGTRSTVLYIVPGWLMSVIACFSAVRSNKRGIYRLSFLICPLVVIESGCAHTRFSDSGLACV